MVAVHEIAVGPTFVGIFVDNVVVTHMVVKREPISDDVEVEEMASGDLVVV